jgi:hypothetical protein
LVFAPGTALPAVTVTALVHPDLRFNEAVFLLNAA